MSIGGSTFPNLTVLTQNISFHYQTLVPGEYYNVVVRATNNGAQRLNATASSDSVEVRMPSVPSCVGAQQHPRLLLMSHGMPGPQACSRQEERSWTPNGERLLCLPEGKTARKVVLVSRYLQLDMLSWTLSIKSAAQVDDSPPQIDPDGQVYNAPGCKVALAQTVTDEMW